MKKKTWIIIGVLVIGIIAAVIYFQAKAAKAAAEQVYQTEAIAKGTLTAMVGATGSVRANQSAHTHLADRWNGSGRQRKGG